MSYREKFVANLAHVSKAVDPAGTVEKLRAHIRKHEQDSREAGDQALTELRSDLGQATSRQTTQQALHKYEKAYLITGKNWSRLKQSIAREFSDSVRLVDAQGGLFDAYLSNNNRKFGTISVGDARFERLEEGDQPINRRQDVYVRRFHHDQRHYIKTLNGQFVQRLVLRGLNQGDASNLDQAQGLTSSMGSAPRVNQSELATTSGKNRNRLPVADYADQNLRIKPQIVSHTRGWWKRFISTTSTKKPAFSTRGTEFRSVFGAVQIDLAMVSQDQVIDLHRPEAAEDIFGFKTSAITQNRSHQLSQQGFANERYLAQRDVIRTREILVRAVPFTAVRMQKQPDLVVGVAYRSKDYLSGSSGRGGATRFQRLVGRTRIESYEKLEYKWGNYYWTFFEFSQTAACDSFYRRARGWTFDSVIKLPQFTPGLNAQV